MSPAAASLSIRSELAALGRVGEWLDSVARDLELPERVVFAIRLCLEEAISNIVHHGFPDEANRAALEKGVRMSLGRMDRDVEVTIVDDGVAFDPLAVATPASPASIEDAAVGGLGIHLMRKFAQHVTYERHDGANRLTLRFDLANNAA